MNININTNINTAKVQQQVVLVAGCQEKLFLERHQKKGKVASNLYSFYFIGVIVRLDGSVLNNFQAVQILVK